MGYASRYVLTSIEDIKMVANGVISGVGRCAPLSEERQFNIALVINELLVNSFEHSKSSSKTPVIFKAGVRDGSLNIGVMDSGEGFEYKRTLKDIEKPVNDDGLFEERGRGLRLVQALCNEINFSGRGNCVEVKINL